MTVEALSLDDPRVEHLFLDVGSDIRYHYQVLKPDVHPNATVLLLHGWYDPYSFSFLSISQLT
jgi:soluble epoxide hydrolase/lipid-phosphate phosphatase